ncbi:MAG TPA: hypothetical protein VND19_22640 [Acetobacteraceae bacterium]|nr:hypothetical protein [Acetobacteraceae bacterium]
MPKLDWRRAVGFIRACSVGRWYTGEPVNRSRCLQDGCMDVDLLTTFGLFAVSAMLVCYALEEKSHWFVLAFAGSCVLGSTYGFLQGAWPFGLVEAVWALIALRRWRRIA